MTLRRRSKKMLGQIWSRPASAWRRITLPSLTRTFRTPKVLDELISLPGYAGPLRQITITELGHEEPTVLLTNQSQRTCPDLVTRYAHRMLIENGISEAIQFFHLDALSSLQEEFDHPQERCHRLALPVAVGQSGQSCVCTGRYQKLNYVRVSSKRSRFKGCEAREIGIVSRGTEAQKDTHCFRVAGQTGLHQSTRPVRVSSS